MNDENIELPAPDVLVAAALYLMTCHAGNGSQFVARMVAHQLCHLAQHPGDDVTPQLREVVCRKLAADWERTGTEQHDAAKTAACGERPATGLHALTQPH